MPRRNSNAVGKPQGVKRKKPTPEVVERKQVSLDFSVASRLDPQQLKALKEVFAK